MDESHRRFRIRFRLRTLFAAVSIVALWLGWNVWTVKQRQGFVASLQHRPRRGYASEFAADGTGQFRGTGGSSLFTWAPGKPDVTISSLQFMFSESNVSAPSVSGISLIRRLLGDRSFASVVLYDAAEVDDARRHFPEAIVVTLPPEALASLRPTKPATHAKAFPEHSVLVRGNDENVGVANP
jgi:hypothetical protein